jgi:hypothetical protein
MFIIVMMKILSLNTQFINTNVSSNKSFSIKNDEMIKFFRFRNVFNEDYSFLDFFVSFFTFISSILNFLSFEQSRLKWFDSLQLKYSFVFINFFLIESKLNVLEMTWNVEIRNWLKFQIVVSAEICSIFSLIDVEIVMMLTVQLIAVFVSISIVTTAFNRQRDLTLSIRL